jgi:hypothetical protein
MCRNGRVLIRNGLYRIKAIQLSLLIEVTWIFPAQVSPLSASGEGEFTTVSTPLPGDATWDTINPHSLYNHSRAPIY